MKFIATLLLSCLVAASTGAPHIPVVGHVHTPVVSHVHTPVVSHVHTPVVSHVHLPVAAGYNHHHLGYNTVGHVKPGHVFTGYNNVHTHLPAYSGPVLRSG